MTAAVPPLHLLLAFEACARHGSFVGAAAELSITPSAVSHRIRDLEDNVGEALFLRRGRRIELTIRGSAYLHDVRAALEGLSKLARPRLGDSRRQRLRIVAPPTFARQLLVPRLAGFTSRHAEVDLEVSVSIPFSEVKAGTADMEVRFADTRSMREGDVCLFEESVFPVASAAYLGTGEINGEPSPAAIARMSLLRTAGDGWSEWFAAAGLDVAEPRSGHLFHDLGLLLEAAAHGQGVALARSVLAAGWLASGAVVRLSSIALASRFAYCAHIAAADAERPAVAAFLGWVRSWPEAAPRAVSPPR